MGCLLKTLGTIGSFVQNFCANFPKRNGYKGYQWKKFYFLYEHIKWPFLTHTK